MPIKPQAIHHKQQFPLAGSKPKACLGEPLGEAEATGEEGEQGLEEEGEAEDREEGAEAEEDWDMSCSKCSNLAALCLCCF